MTNDMNDYEIEMNVRDIIFSDILENSIESVNITPDTDLYIKGVGLDEIDLITIALKIRDKFGIKLIDKPSNYKKFFKNINNIVSFVKDNVK